MTGEKFEIQKQSSDEMEVAQYISQLGRPDFNSADFDDSESEDEYCSRDCAVITEYNSVENEIIAEWLSGEVTTVDVDYCFTCKGRYLIPVGTTVRPCPRCFRPGDFLPQKFLQARVPPEVIRIIGEVSPNTSRLLCISMAPLIFRGLLDLAGEMPRVATETLLGLGASQVNKRIYLVDKARGLHYPISGILMHTRLLLANGHRITLFHISNPVAGEVTEKYHDGEGNIHQPHEVPLNNRNLIASYVAADRALLSNPANGPLLYAMHFPNPVLTERPSLQMYRDLRFCNLDVDEPLPLLCVRVVENEGAFKADYDNCYLLTSLKLAGLPRPRDWWLSLSEATRLVLFLIAISSNPLRYATNYTTTFRTNLFVVYQHWLLETPYIARRITLIKRELGWDRFQMNVPPQFQPRKALIRTKTNWAIVATLALTQVQATLGAIPAYIPKPEDKQQSDDINSIRWMTTAVLIFQALKMIFTSRVFRKLTSRLREYVLDFISRPEDAFRVAKKANQFWADCIQAHGESDSPDHDGPVHTTEYLAQYTNGNGQSIWPSCSSPPDIDDVLILFTAFTTTLALYVWFLFETSAWIFLFPPCYSLFVALVYELVRHSRSHGPMAYAECGSVRTVTCYLSTFLLGLLALLRVTLAILSIHVPILNIATTVLSVLYLLSRMINPYIHSPIMTAVSRTVGMIFDSRCYLVFWLYHTCLSLCRIQTGISNFYLAVIAGALVLLPGQIAIWQGLSRLKPMDNYELAEAITRRLFLKVILVSVIHRLESHNLWRIYYAVSLLIADLLLEDRWVDTPIISPVQVIREKYYAIKLARLKWKNRQIPEYDDESVLPDDGSLDGFSLRSEVEIDTIDVPPVVDLTLEQFGQTTNTIVDILSYDSPTMTYALHIVGLLNGPAMPKSGDKLQMARVLAHYTTHLHLLVSHIVRNNKFRSKQVVSWILAQAGVVEQTPRGESKDGSTTATVKSKIEDESWLIKIATGFESIAGFTTSPVSTAVSNLLTFISLGPVLLCEVMSAETILSMWKRTNKALKTEGTSMSNLLSFMADCGRKIQAAKASGSYKEVIKSVFTSTDSTYRRVRADVVRALDPKSVKIPTNLPKLYDRLRLVTIQMQSKCNLPGASIVERKQLEEAYEFESKLAVAMAARKTKYTPWSLNIVGPPGVGKSVFADHCGRFMHRVMGWSKIQHVANIMLAHQRDDCVKNFTTMLKYDDQAALHDEKRVRPYADHVIMVHQPEPWPVNSARAEEKGFIFYLNKFTMHINNREDLGFIKEIEVPYAGYRRIAMNLAVMLKPEFANDKGILNKNHPDLKPYGNQLLYRRFEYKNPDYNHPQNPDGADWYYVSGWMTHEEVYALIKEEVQQHFEEEDARLSAAQSHEKEEMCPKCLYTSRKNCGCGTAMFDANETESVGSSDPPSVAEATYATAVAEVLGPDSWRPWTPRPNVDWRTHVACQIRYALLGTGVKARMLDTLVTYYPLELLLLVALNFSVLFFVQTLLLVYLGVALFSACALLFLSRIRRSLGPLINMSTQEVMEIHSSYLALSSTAFKFLAAAISLGGGAVAWKRLVANTTGRGEAVVDDSTDDTSTIATAESSHRYRKDVPKYVANEEGDVIVTTKKPQVAKKEWAKVTYQKLEAPHPARTINKFTLIGKVQRNLFLVKIVVGDVWDEDRAKTSHLLFLTSRIAVVVAHSVIGKTLIAGRFSMRVYDHFTQKWRDPVVVYEQQLFYADPDGPTGMKDLFVIYLPDMPSNFRESLVPYLSTRQGVGQQTYTWVSRDIDTGMPNPIQENMPGQRHPSKYNTTFTKIENDDTLKINSNQPSHPGNCGTVYISETCPHVIAGIHVASTTGTLLSCMTGTEVFAEVLSLEFFEEAREHFSQFGFYCQDLEKLSKFGAFRTNIDVKDIVPSNHPVHYLPDGCGAVVHGYVPVNSRLSSGVQINEDLPKAIEYLKLKVNLFPAQHNWKISYQDALRNTTKQLPYGSIPMMEKALQTVENMFKKCVAKTKTQFPEIDFSKPLTLSEALNGIDGIAINGIALQTGASSPYKGKKGDHVYVCSGEEKVLMAEEFRDHVIYQICLVLGIDPNILRSSDLKGELRKKQKIGNSRPFYAGWLMELLVDKQFQAKLLACMTSCPTLSRTAIGLNRLGEEWYEACEPFYRPDWVNNCYCIDVKRNDQSQSPIGGSYRNKIVERIGKLVGLNEFTMDLLSKTLATKINPEVMMGGALVQVLNLFLSGLFMTAHGNTLWVILLVNYDFVRFCMETEGWEDKWEEIEEYHHTNGLGDDMLGCVCGKFREAGWTPSHLVESASHWGVTISAADKSEIVSFMHADNMDFLKSSINYQEDIGMNVNVIGPKSYFKGFIGFDDNTKIPHPIRRNELTGNAMREAFFGGRIGFERLQARFIRFYDALKIPYPDALKRSYEEWVEMYKLPEPQPQLTQVTERSDMLLSEYAEVEHAVELKLFLDYHFNTSNTTRSSSESKSIETITSLILDTWANGEAEVDEAVTTAPDGIADVPTADETVTQEYMKSAASSLGMTPLTSAQLMLTERIHDITTFTWNTSGVFSPITMKPHVTVLNRAFVSARLDNVASIRCDVEVKIEATCPDMYSGAMIFGVVHFPEPATKIPGSGIMAVSRLSQKEHVILNLQDSKVVSITVPFWLNKASLNPNSDELTHMPVLRAIQLAPIRSAMGAPVDISVRVTGKLINVDTFGATAYSSVRREYFGEAEPPESFSGAATAASNVLQMAAKVPGMGALELPSQVIGKVGEVAKSLGFSKPMEMGFQPTTMVTAPGFSNSRGPIVGNVLSPDPAQNVSIDGTVSGVVSDGATFEAFCRKWSIIRKLSVTTSQTIGTELTNFNVTPSIFNFEAAGDGIHLTRIQPASCAVPAIVMSKWHGSMEYEFTFYGPSTTSGEVLISFEPIFAAAQQTENKPPVYTTNVCSVWDITEKKTCTFQCNWGSKFPALETLPGFSGKHRYSSAFLQKIRPMDDQPLPIDTPEQLWSHREFGIAQGHNGNLTLAIHQPFRTASGKADNFVITIRARCGPDMEWYHYAGSNPRPKWVVAKEDHQDYSLYFDESQPTQSNSLAFYAPGREMIAFGESPQPESPPTETPTEKPTSRPTNPPTQRPTEEPTQRPTGKPTSRPTAPPTKQPTPAPTQQPTEKPTMCLTATDERKISMLTERNQKMRVMRDTETGDEYYEIWGEDGHIFELFFLDIPRCDNETDLFLHLYVGNLSITEWWQNADGFSWITTPEPRWAPVSSTLAKFIYRDISIGPTLRSLRFWLPTNSVVRFKSLEYLVASEYRQSENANPWWMKKGLDPVLGAPQTNYKVNQVDGIGEMYYWEKCVVKCDQSVQNDQDFLHPLEGFTFMPLYIEYIGAIEVFADDSLIWKKSTNFMTYDFIQVPKSATNVWFRNVGGPGSRRISWITYTAPTRHLEEKVDKDQSLTGKVASYFRGEAGFSAGSKPDPIFVRKSLAGESVSSFRELLKIPTRINRYLIDGDPGKFLIKTTRTPLYGDSSFEDEFNLFDYMKRCYAGMRGGMVSSYNIYGDAQLEIQSCRAGYRVEGSAPRAFIDSRVQPHGSVKFPSPGILTFFYSPHAPGCDLEKVVTARIWDGAVAVEEYSSIAEDFIFLQNMGAAILYNGTGPPP